MTFKYIVANILEFGISYFWGWILYNSFSQLVNNIDKYFIVFIIGPLLNLFVNLLTSKHYQFCTNKSLNLLGLKYTVIDKKKYFLSQIHQLMWSIFLWGYISTKDIVFLIVFISGFAFVFIGKLMIWDLVVKLPYKRISKT